MKKIYALAILATASLALTAQAETKTGTLDIGDFEGCTTYIYGQNIERAPFNFYFTNSGTQLIYTAEDIAPLVEAGAKITSLTFRFGDPEAMSYYDLSYNLHAYMQLIDADRFTLIDGKTNWFTPGGDSAIGEGTFTFDMIMDMASEDIPATVTFATPFEIPKTATGKSLLITSWATLDTGDSEGGQCIYPYAENNAARTYRMACFASDTKDNFIEQVNTGALIDLVTTGTDVYNTDIPVLRISYTYEDTADGIECISTPEEDAPAQYFNLQGQRIYYPEPGQLVIKRQGSQAVKTIIR